jgi:hypothetical protein
MIYICCPKCNSVPDVRSDLGVEDDDVAVAGADGHDGGARVVGGAGTLGLNRQLPEHLLLPPLCDDLGPVL